jgi:hypothetical protein
MKLLDLTTSCKEWIVQKAFAQDSTALNLCSLFDRETEDINSGETTLNCCVTSIDKSMMAPSTRKGKGKGKGKDSSDKAKKQNDSAAGGGRRGKGGKRSASPARSVTSTNTKDTEAETSDDEEEEQEIHDVRINDADESEVEGQDEESVDSPEQTVAELCATGFDWQAGNRPSPVCTDSLKEPGSLLKALSVDDAPIDRVIKQRIEELEDSEMKLEIAEKDNKALKRKVSELEGQIEVMRMMKKSRNSKDVTPEQRQMISDVSAEIRKRFVRQVKFPRKEGWQYWSDDPKSASGMIADRINWPAGCTKENKAAIWNTLIAKAIPRIVTTARNKITQEIREKFWGRYMCYTMH